jgi:hypothetical protein
MTIILNKKINYCLTDLIVDRNDITVLVSVEQKHFTEMTIILNKKIHYCLTDLTVDSNDITVLVSVEQKH